MQNTACRALSLPFVLSQKLVSLGTWKKTSEAGGACQYPSRNIPCDGASGQNQSERYQNEESFPQLQRGFCYTRNKRAGSPVQSAEVSLEEPESTHSKKEELGSIQNGAFQITNIPSFEPLRSTPVEQAYRILPAKSDTSIPNIFKISESVPGDSEATTLNFCLHLRSVLDLKNQQCIFATEAEQSQKLYSWMLSRNKVIIEQIESYRKKRRRVRNRRERRERTLEGLREARLNKLEAKSKVGLCNLQGINASFKTRNIDKILKKAKEKLLERVSSVVPFRLIELQDEQCSKENQGSSKKKSFNQFVLRRSISRKKIVDYDPSFADSISEKEHDSLGLSNKPFGFVTRLKPLTKEERVDPEGIKHPTNALGKIMGSYIRFNRD